jgi:hypothetical protein
MDLGFMDLGFLCAPKFDLPATVNFSHPYSECWIEREKISPPTNRAIDPNRYLPFATSFLPELERVQAAISGSYSSSEMRLTWCERTFLRVSIVGGCGRSQPNDSLLRFWVSPASLIGRAAMKYARRSMSAMAISRRQSRGQERESHELRHPQSALANACSEPHRFW